MAKEVSVVVGDVEITFGVLDEYVAKIKDVKVR